MTAGLDLDALTAIDVHVHAEVSSRGSRSLPAEPEEAVATHKPGVHIDRSGWSPEYFPPQLVQYPNSPPQDKVMLGSDYPMLTPTGGWPISRNCRSSHGPGEDPQN